MTSRSKNLVASFILPNLYLGCPWAVVDNSELTETDKGDLELQSLAQPYLVKVPLPQDRTLLFYSAHQAAFNSIRELRPSLFTDAHISFSNENLHRAVRIMHSHIQNMRSVPEEFGLFDTSFTLHDPEDGVHLLPLSLDMAVAHLPPNIHLLGLDGKPYCLDDMDDFQDRLFLHLTQGEWTDKGVLRVKAVEV